MTLAQSASHPEFEIEGLLSALNGVLAARVALSPLGRLEEIHVLSDASMHPKQMVRNIESALSAGLGIVVDRRIVSVAQVRADDAAAASDAAADQAAADQAAADAAAREAVGRAAADREAADQEAADQEAADQAAAVQAAAQAAADEAAATAESAVAFAGSPAPGRYIFVGYDARTQPDLEAACRVTIRRDDHVYSGTGSGPSTSLGRAQSAARAVFAAIAAARRSQSLGLEGVTLVESHGRPYVLVAAHAMQGRSTVPLTGVAALHRSPEEAAILAALQATNRWNELDD
jgi:hypothetical protein